MMRLVGVRVEYCRSVWLGEEIHWILIPKFQENRKF